MGRHDKTLADIFHEPAKANISWKAIESMFTHFGAEVTEGNGSRVRVCLNGVRAVFHRPHPGKEAGKCTVVDVRRFLTNAGIVP
jgi:hypothetical protein